jgi:CheY-like chemotaxis protein
MKKYKKVLLIDDDSITNFINSTVVKKAGLGDLIKIVLNGQEALEYIKQDCKAENNYPDLIFVDINMPVMDGFEFVKEFQKLKIKAVEEIEIVVLTTSSDPRDIQKTKKLGIKILRKPLSIRMIEENFGEKKALH